MSALKLVLLSLVGFCLCDDFESLHRSLYQFSPENQIEIVKSILRFGNQQIFDRWWFTENLTCAEVKTVTQMMQQNIQSDLSLLMADLKKLSKKESPPNKRRMRRCLRDINEDMEEAIKEGVDHFSKCIKAFATVRDLGMAEIQEKRREYDENINYILQNIDSCLVFSNSNSKVLLEECLQQMMVDNLRTISAAYTIFTQSTCMAHFTNNIINCTSDVFDKMIVNKMILQKDIERCTGYTVSDPVQKNFGIKIKHLLSKYTEAYTEMELNYDELVLQSIGESYEWSTKKDNGLNKTYYDWLNQNLQAYYFTINKAQEENWSREEQNCSTAATEKLNQLIVEGSRDFVECHIFNEQQRREVINGLNSTIIEFNAKLAEAGNLALLRCIEQRPQQVFGSDTIGTCAELAERNFSLELKSAKIRIENVKNAHQTNVNLLPSGKYCGALRYEKLMLDAEEILYDCTRCLYGASGDYYPVTTPRTTVTFKPETSGTDHPEETSMWYSYDEEVVQSGFSDEADVYYIKNREYTFTETEAIIL